MIRAILVILAVLTALVAIAGAFRFYESEPMDDLRQGADAIPLPKDFVLVTESYSPGASGMFGAVPHLQRVYHASWPGLCDSLHDLGDRLGGVNMLAPVSPEYAERMCNRGASQKTSWRGRLRNYRNYEVRLTAWRPGFAEGPVFDRPEGIILLYPRRGVTTDQKIVIPEGRARVDIELIAHRGW